MRYNLLGCAFVLFTLLIVLGCSSRSSETPVSPDGDNTPVANDTSNGHNVLLTGTFEIDLEKMEIRDVPTRDPAYHINITSIINPYFKYFITGMAWPNITVRLELTNPTAIQAYDVRIIYTNLHGKSVRNPDGYTNYLDPPGGPTINPFHYFAKEYPNQAFPVGPGAKDTEILELKWNPGSDVYVTYAIECCLEENAAEPYKISDFSRLGVLTKNGGASVLTVLVSDWQNDITSVKVLANDFYNEDLPMYKYRTTNYYLGNLVNLNNVAAGDYQVWIQAESNSPAGIKLWMPFTITITTDEDDAPKFGNIPFATKNPISKGVFTYLSCFAEDPEGDSIDYSWEQISPTSPTGSFSGSGGRFVPYARWDPPQVGADTQYIFRINAEEANGTKISRAVVGLMNLKPLGPVITEAPIINPNPIYENALGQFGVKAHDPMFPGEVAPFNYLWEQISPVSPTGTWQGTSYGQGQYPVWVAPSVNADTMFTFKVTVTKWWVSPQMTTSGQVQFTVKNR